jgi:hypothetical protein
LPDCNSIAIGRYNGHRVWPAHPSIG